MRVRHVGGVVAALVAACQGSAPPVGPPPTYCAAVADKLAALALGSDATPADRATFVAAQLVACTAADVTVAEGECIGKATDRWLAARCAPRLFPDAAPSEAADCGDVIARLTRAIPDLSAGDGSIQLMAVLKVSCVEDGWPDTLKRCMLDAKADPTGGFKACSQNMPPAIKDKVTARITAAMQLVTH